MSVLADFNQRNFLEQIILLEDIREKKDVAAIHDLMDLYAHPLGDEAVDSKVFYVLSKLLDGREEEILAGLSHGSARVKRLCTEKAGTYRIPRAIPLLQTLLKETDEPVMLAEIIKTLGEYSEKIKPDAFIPYIRHDDPTVAALAIEQIARTKDPLGRDRIIDLIADSRDFSSKGIADCEFITGVAIESLTIIGDETAINFLVAAIHHANPLIRRMVREALVSMGSKSYSGLTRALTAGNGDEQIIAANIIGFIGGKKGADILTARMDNKQELTANVKFAIYEALGRIKSLRSNVCLLDGLDEENELILVAVITGLDNLFNVGMIGKFKEVLEKKDVQAERVLKTIIMARAIHLFGALYEQETLGDRLIAALIESNDKDALETLSPVLKNLAFPRAQADLARLIIRSQRSDSGARRIVAADDSKAMRHFYFTVATELDMPILTHIDGSQTLEYFKAGGEADLLITDMNMPVMDGIELAREVRKLHPYLPIIMATTETEKSQALLAKKAGVTAFLTKPFPKETLKEKIAQLLPASQ